MRTKLPIAILTLMGVLTIGLATAGCNSGSGTTTTTSGSPSQVSYSRDIQPIFNNNCIVCHQITGQAGLALEPSKSYAQLVGVQSTQAAGRLRVKAGEPAQSYLLDKLNGTQVQAGGTGVRMPQGLPALSQNQVNLIKTWIEEGAKNN